MSTTTIQWTQSDDGAPGMTWNPLVGCDLVSSGCLHCYAATLHNRRYLAWKRGVWPSAPTQYQVPFWHNVQLKPERLAMPLRWRNPRRVFVNSVSDLFHPVVPDTYIAQVFGVMAMTPQHTYQVLTKRPERMTRWIREWTHERCVAYSCDLLGDLRRRTSHQAIERIGAGWPWPLPNVWLGTSVENQATADERIPALFETPAAVRFLSCEPLLSYVRLTDHLRPQHSFPPAWGTDSWATHEPAHLLDWCIIGGESGPHARRMDLDWADDLRGMCRTAHVAVFVKQLGTVWAKEHNARDAHGGDMSEWPERLRVREFPTTNAQVP